MSNSETTVWSPDKPAAAFTEDEIRQAPDFKTLRGVMPESVEDEKVLDLARQTIEARWVTIRDDRRSELVESFVERLRECDPDLAKVSRIEITLSDEGTSMEFKKERAPRWDAETYASRAGSYSKEYTSAKHPESSGEYKLEIAGGRNENETVFMRLIEPSGRVLQFPAVNEDSLVGRDAEGNPAAGADVVECSSISRLLRDSSHKTTLSVWQYFNLKREDAAPESN